MATPTTHVLLIGIDAYPGPSPGPLGGCVNDIDQIQQIVRGPLGVDRKSVIRLAAPRAGTKHDESVASRKPTRTAIIEALRVLGGDQVKPDDRVFIYYSGHGASIALDSGEAVVLREALVPVDAFFDSDGTPRNLLFDVELNCLLRRIAQRTTQVTVVLDCCHSVGATRDVQAGREDLARTVPIEGRFRPADVGLEAQAARDTAGIFEGNAASIETCVVAAACLADEAAMEGAHPGGLRGGYFTRAFLDQLRTFDPGRLSSMRWGHIWRQLSAGVEASVRQHPRLLGSFARDVFGSPPREGDTGFGIRLEGSEYVLDAGELAGVTSEALVGVYGAEPAILPLDVQSPSDLQARKGVLRVTGARRSSATAVPVEGARPFDLVPGARARVIAPGLGAKLRVAVTPGDAEIERAVEGSPFLALAGPDEPPAVTMKRCRNGDWAITDDLHGTGDDPDELYLCRIPKESPGETFQRVLEHYARYIAPVDMARRCTDLTPGTLTVRMLDCRDFALDADGRIADPQLDPQSPDLRATAPGPDHVYDVIEGRTSFCYEARNNSSNALFVTLIESGSSGRVNLSFGGQVAIPARGRHVFWWGATPKSVIVAALPDGRSIALDRLVAIGTTNRSRTMDFLASHRSFEDVLQLARDGAPKEGARRIAEPDVWTSAGLIVRARRLSTPPCIASGT